MTLKPISKFDKWIQGTAPLPAGAVPLAADNFGVVCLMPSGRWIMWLGGVIHTRPPESQRAVMEVVIGQLGGTATTAGVALDVSPRTIEAWRSGKAPLPIKSAYTIANVLAAL